MLGLHLVVVAVSARFFMPALQRASGAEAPRSRLATPRVAPVVAIAPVDEQILTAPFYAGLAPGLAILFLGVTSAIKAKTKSITINRKAQDKYYPLKTMNLTIDFSIIGDKYPLLKYADYIRGLKWTVKSAAVQKMIVSDADRLTYGDNYIQSLFDENEQDDGADEWGMG